MCPFFCSVPGRMRVVPLSLRQHTSMQRNRAAQLVEHLDIAVPRTASGVHFPHIAKILAAFCFMS